MNDATIRSESVQDTLKDKIKVMLVDDHSLMRDSLKLHLENQPNIKVVAEASDGEEAVKLAAEVIPDIIIMDIAMPKLNGIEATRQIKAKFPKMAIIALTVHTDIEYILTILETGAAGYLTKDIYGDEIAKAIQLVVSGESLLSEDVLKKLVTHALKSPVKPSMPTSVEKLSHREMEVLILAAKGKSNKEIAQELNLNLRTVKGHFENVFSKLNVSSRTEAINIGLKTGLLTFEDIIH